MTTKAIAVCFSGYQGQKIREQFVIWYSFFGRFQLLMARVAVLSPVYTFSTVLFCTRYLMVKKVNANNVIFAADNDKNTYQITSSKITVGT
jgi:hypothetical protein